MGPLDKVQEHYEKLIKAAKHLDVSEEQKIAVFVKGLPRFIKSFVIRKEPQTLREALTLAKQQELIGPDSDQDDETNRLLKAILSKVGESTVKPANVAVIGDEIPSLPPRTNFSCHYCGGPNHYMTDCCLYETDTPHTVHVATMNTQPPFCS